MDLKKLNEIPIKDQIIAKLSSKLLAESKLDTIQTKILLKHTNELYFENILTLYEISKKYNNLPNSKNFNIIQAGYETSLIHNFRENTDKTWNLLFPYFKKAYLNHEITDVVFRNYDFYCYLTHGYQEFDSFKIFQIPKNFRKNEKEIPLKDKIEFEKIKNEFKWF